MCGKQLQLRLVAVGVARADTTFAAGASDENGFVLFIFSYLAKVRRRIRISRPLNAVSFRFCSPLDGDGSSDDDQREVADGYRDVCVCVLIRRDRIRARPDRRVKERKTRAKCVYIWST